MSTSGCVSLCRCDESEELPLGGGGIGGSLPRVRWEEERDGLVE